MATKAVILRGRQATGKTTIGKELSTYGGTCLLSKDDIYIHARTELSDHHAASRVAYGSVRSLIASNRESGLLFVVDAPFHEPGDTTRLIADCAGWGVIVRSVLLICPDETEWDRRLKGRQRERTPNHLITSLSQLVAVQGDVSSERIPDEPVFDTSLLEHTPARIAKEIYEFMQVQADDAA